MTTAPFANRHRLHLFGSNHTHSSLSCSYAANGGGLKIWHSADRTAGSALRAGQAWPTPDTKTAQLDPVHPSRIAAELFLPSRRVSPADTRHSSSRPNDECIMISFDRVSFIDRHNVREKNCFLKKRIWNSVSEVAVIETEDAQ